MSETASIIEQQQQQQPEYVGSSSISEYHCKDCGVYFESVKSLEVHLRYHQENLLSQWATEAQQEESNNNSSKAGNHNSHVSVKKENVSTPTDSSEPLRSPVQDPTSSKQQQTQQQQTTNQTYNHYQTPMYSSTSEFFMQNEPSYILPHHFSPPEGEQQNNGGGSGGGGGSNYSRYHPYQHPQHFPSERATSLNSTSPQHASVHCEKCGAVYDDTHQLGEHIRANHSNSPTTYQSASQYQQLGNSPQHQTQQQPQQSLHLSPSQTTQQQQQQQQSNYDYNGGQTIKTEIKHEPDEQAEILDLDSHKVQTHRYEEELNMIRLQQRDIQMHMHQQQVMQQQQHRTAHTMSLLNWSPPVQHHEYHHGLTPMVAMDNVSPMPDQNQFMRGPHILEPPGHQSSQIITSPPSVPSHQMAAALLQQPQPKQSQIANQSWKSNEARRPKTYNCTACNKWFTSSGHLKRHYNTTLHKNAVKQSNQPDPANLPISAHHHPGRENNTGRTSGRGGGGISRSPELTSGSPPNLMAGPSGEAARGLLHTPTTTTATTMYNSNSNSNSSSSNESSVQAAVQQQQQSPSTTCLGSGIIPLNSTGHPPSMVVSHPQQMDSPSHQLVQQQPSQLRQLRINSPILSVHHQPMNTSMSPVRPPPVSHMNTHSQMDSSSHQQHLNSLPPLISGSGMTSPPMMGGPTMPHQPYPNALPPHVSTTTSPPETLESITVRLISTGSQQHNEDKGLPGFGTFNSQVALSSFTQFSMAEFITGPNNSLPQAINVGGQNTEETLTPQETPFESPSSMYDSYANESPHYESMTNMQSIPSSIDGMIIKRYMVEDAVPNQEANNNVPYSTQAKEEVNPNITHLQNGKRRKIKIRTKIRPVTTGKIGSHYISQDGFHKCIECDKVFNKACYLTQHNKSFHSGDKPFKCSQCGKRFPVEVQHSEHLLKHAGDKPYKCEMCPKQFNHKTDLRRHLCLHTGEKPYTCHECGKGFIRKDHMMKHLETHRKKGQNINVGLRA